MSSTFTITPSASERLGLDLSDNTYRATGDSRRYALPLYGTTDLLGRMRGPMCTPEQLATGTCAAASLPPSAPQQAVQRPRVVSRARPAAPMAPAQPAVPAAAEPAPAAPLSPLMLNISPAQVAAPQRWGSTGARGYTNAPCLPGQPCAGVEDSMQAALSQDVTGAYLRGEAVPAFIADAIDARIAGSNKARIARDTSEYDASLNDAMNDPQTFADAQRYMEAGVGAKAALAKAVQDRVPDMYRARTVAPNAGVFEEEALRSNENATIFGGPARAGVSYAPSVIGGERGRLLYRQGDTTSSVPVPQGVSSPLATSLISRSALGLPGVDQKTDPLAQLSALTTAASSPLAQLKIQQAVANIDRIKAQTAKALRPPAAKAPAAPKKEKEKSATQKAAEEKAAAKKNNEFLTGEKRL
jgi:hypothetical protein